MPGGHCYRKTANCKKTNSSDKFKQNCIRLHYALHTRQRTYKIAQWTLVYLLTAVCMVRLFSCKFVRLDVHTYWQLSGNSEHQALSRMDFNLLEYETIIFIWSCWTILLIK